MLELSEDVDAFLKHKPSPLHMSAFSLEDGINKAVAYLLENRNLSPDDQLSIANSVIAAL